MKEICKNKSFQNKEGKTISMKKILFAVHTLQVGGAERVLLNILKNIDKDKYDITVLALVNDGIYIEELKKIKEIHYKYIFNPFCKQRKESETTFLYKMGRKLVSQIWKIYLFLIKHFPRMLYKKGIKEKYDVEIAFLEGKVSKIIANSTNHDSKKIAWIHTDIHNESRNKVFKSNEEEKECYKKFDKIICVSEEVKKRFIKKTGIHENVYVQINPIPSKEIIEKAKEPIEEVLSRNGYVVSTVGRLVKEKGYDRLLEVHRRLIIEGITHTLWIIGDGEEKKNLESYIKKNNLEQTVNLLGFKENPYKYVKNSDIFVCSSRVEGLSSAVLEATILEKVIVSTDCPGAKEILGSDGQAALIVKNSTEGLYNGLKQILTDSTKREELKQNIKLRSKPFEIDNIMKDIEKIIEE